MIRHHRLSVISQAFVKLCRTFRLQVIIDIPDIFLIIRLVIVSTLFPLHVLLKCNLALINHHTCFSLPEFYDTLHNRKTCRMRTKTFLITMSILVTTLVILQIIHSVLLDQLNEYERFPSQPAVNNNGVSIYKVVSI